jgi:molecular chaperone GrpE (heat shock protein)
MTKKRNIRSGDHRALIRILDHIFAFHKAAAQSNQPKLIEQTAQLQKACMEEAEKVDLNVFVASPNETFKPVLYQLAGKKTQAITGSLVAETLVPGYILRGKILRPALVRLVEPGPVPGRSFSG